MVNYAQKINTIGIEEQLSLVTHAPMAITIVIYSSFDPVVLSIVVVFDAVELPIVRHDCTFVCLLLPDQLSY